jgi:iron complex transport system ATP-binding protein
VPTPVIQFEDVHFFRGSKKILTSIDWKVCSGEHWAVLGPNGAGKSTLLKILLGYESSSRGRTYLLSGWHGETALPESRKKVGYISGALQDHLLKWRDTALGEEIVSSGRHAIIGDHWSATAAEREEARLILAELGVARLAGRVFRVMSTGERQLCLVARARMARSELTIYDEPCAGLDIRAREILLSALDRATAQTPFRPSILVTHHIEEISAGITHVLLLREGRIVAQGLKEVVLNSLNLSETFGLPLDLISAGDRYTVLPRSS